MEWRSVRLTRNCWRGAAGNLVEVPQVAAKAMVADGRAVDAYEDAAREVMTAIHDLHASGWYQRLVQRPDINAIMEKLADA